MKCIILIFLCFFCYGTFAQKLPDYGLNKIRITDTGKTIVAEIELVPTLHSTKPKLLYYWFSGNMIHVTQGGYSGKLLNGQYTEYYPDKNLKEQGAYKKGLKDGVWKSWNDDGSLAVAITWKHGSEISSKRPPIWKRIHPFKKKARTADSLNYVKK
jgi:hypothetical protein